MKYQLFGSKNVRTSEELRSIGRRNKRVTKIEDWALDAEASSALRVSTLSSPGENVLPFGQLKKITKKKVGIYSCSQDFSRQVMNKLILPGFELYNFSNRDHQSGFSIEQAGLMELWLIHMQDDDENPLLDVLLDLGSNTESLFLCEQSLSTQCYKKIENFMQQTKQAC
ncbi:MAG: hypothetical protein ACMZ64_08465 [Oleiphilus sp.]